MIKITYLGASSIRELFFESRLEASSWLKSIDIDEKVIFVDHCFEQPENLRINFLNRVKNIMILEKLIGA